jgi:hypothetical protein
MLAADAGMGGISLTGFTLKSELLHPPVTSSTKTPATSAAAFR